MVFLNNLQYLFRLQHGSKSILQPKHIFTKLNMPYISPH